MAAPFDPAAHPGLAELAARLRELAGDNAYQAGRDYLRKGLVRQGAVAGTTAYATVTGSTDYRVSVGFAAEPKVTCSCPAHRRSKFCKHVVAVCAALLERPADFAATEPAPEPSKRPSRRAAGPTGARRKQAAPAQLQATGLDTVDRLLAELADGGLMSLGSDKAALLAGAGELVRSLKLRRLGNLVLALQRAAAGSQSGPARRSGSPGDQPMLESAGFSELLIDAYLARRATGAHLEGRVALDPRLAEDLLGKTWRDEELEPIAGMEMVEVGFTVANDGEFRVETSYLAELARGEVYVERAITPIRLHAAPKLRHRLRVLVDSAGLYPGVAPRRLKLRRVRQAPLSLAHVERLVAAAPDDLTELCRRLVERQQVPFGPAEVAHFFRPAALLTRERQIGAVDRAGRFLAITWPDVWTDRLPPLLPPPGRYALFGLLRLDESAARLHCLSAVGALEWDRGPVFADVG